MYNQQASSGAKLLQATAMNKAGARPWLTKVPSASTVSELLGTNGVTSGPGVQTGGAGPGGAGGASQAGSNNLVQVMDSEGKLYYYNTEC